MSSPRKPTKTVMLLGAEKSGKSSLVKKYIHSIFTESYKPSFEGANQKDITVDHQTYTLELIPFDAIGENAICQTGDALILLYAINNRKSLQHLRQLHQQIKQAKDNNSTRTPIFLVGSKADLESERQVSLEDARQVAIELHCQKFFEISSKNHIGEINDMFGKLMREIIRHEQSNSSSRTMPAPPSTAVSSQTTDTMASLALADSPRRSSNVFERLKFGSLKRKGSFHSVTRKKSGSFGESILSVASGKRSRDNLRAAAAYETGTGTSTMTSSRASTPFKLDVDTSSWREAIKWPTEIIPEEDLKAA